MLSLDIKYPEKRKKAPSMVNMREFPVMKSGARALRNTTNEFAMTTISQTMNTKKRNAFHVLLRPTSQYTGTANRIAIIIKKGRKTRVLEMTYDETL